MHDGVREGRTVFGNIVKYIRMSTSSSFGNMLSVLGASIFLPFLPMAPVQVLFNNLLYDLSQIAVPTDRVDEEYLAQPRRWAAGNVMRYMFAIGPISSLFDGATFLVLLYGFGAWADPALFQSGWFVESLLSQSLIVHVLRTGRMPFVQSKSSLALAVMTLAVCAVGVALPYSAVAGPLRLVPLPLGYWTALTGILLGYLVATQLAKRYIMQHIGLD